MGRTIWFFVWSFALAMLGACSGTTASSTPSPSPRPAEGDGPTQPGETSDTPRPATDGKLGIVAIDLQKVFFQIANARNPTSKPDERMGRAAKIFQLAAEKEIPLFVTYEDAKSGDHALPPALASVLPKHAREIIKTTFAATGQKDFVPAIEAAGVKRLLVLGAETDVCVLQTMLGLRKRGFEVIAVTDALVTEEVNAAPALRRMTQSGIAQVTMADAEALLTQGTGALPPSTGEPTILRPLETGLVLHDIVGLDTADTNAAAKRVRLRELLLVSEWFTLPVLAENPAATLAALPQDLRSILSRPIVALAERPSNVTQLVVFGGRTKIDRIPNVETFLVTDAILGAKLADLEPVFVAGAIPTTYKTLWYELTQSVDDREWPSQEWVKASDIWFDRTKAPEDLPQLVP